MVLVFDLDDTLIPELSFVHSGFQAVANWLHVEFKVSAPDAFQFMVQTEQTLGRGKVFNLVLERYGLKTSKALVQCCVSVYRLHKPVIQLHPDAMPCLQHFADSPKYIVTDGNKVVQYNKIKALGIEPLFKKVLVSHRYGIQHAKPSPYCFQLIAKREKVQPNQVVYIGDNPNKDFVGIKPLGFKTIRILRGNFAHLNKPASHEADFNIHSLDELPSIINTL